MDVYVKKVPIIIKGVLSGPRPLRRVLFFSLTSKFEKRIKYIPTSNDYDNREKYSKADFVNSFN